MPSARLVLFPRASLHSEVLCQYPLYVYGSEAYLARKGIPQCVRDLDHHDLIVWKEPIAEAFSKERFNALSFMGRNSKDPRQPCMEVDMDVTIITAVRDGIGLGFLPAFFGDVFPNMHRILLCDMNQADYIHGKHITYLKTLKESVRHQALVAFIKDKARTLSNSVKEQQSQKNGGTSMIVSAFKIL